MPCCHNLVVGSFFSLVGLKNRRDLFVSLKTGNVLHIMCCTQRSLPVIFSHATCNWIIYGDTISQCTIHSPEAVFVGGVGLFYPRNKKQREHAAKNMIIVFNVLRQSLKGGYTMWKISWNVVILAKLKLNTS